MCLVVASSINEHHWQCASYSWWLHVCLHVSLPIVTCTHALLLNSSSLVLLCTTAHTLSCFSPVRPHQHTGSGLSPELRAALEKFVTENKIVLFIKGTKQFPQCGFSNTVVQIFNQIGAPYETVNVLDNELIRSGMKEYSQWPTYPQVWIDGELFGGCDITLGMRGGAGRRRNVVCMCVFVSHTHTHTCVCL